jgi:hypothetical protein
MTDAQESKKLVEIALNKARRDTRDLRTQENGGVCPDCSRDSWFCLCNKRDDGHVTSGSDCDCGEKHTTEPQGTGK